MWVQELTSRRSVAELRDRQDLLGLRELMEHPEQPALWDHKEHKEQLVRQVQWR
jgi:hypothetical protein